MAGQNMGEGPDSRGLENHPMTIFSSSSMADSALQSAFSPPGPTSCPCPGTSLMVVAVTLLWAIANFKNQNGHEQETVCCVPIVGHQEAS